MRCETVNSLKGKYNINRLREKPREGSKLRALYDQFKANPGSPVNIPDPHVIHSNGTIRQLTDFYGLDILLTQRGDSRANRITQYTLVGEWFGKVYVDYLAQKMEK